MGKSGHFVVFELSILVQRDSALKKCCFWNSFFIENSGICLFSHGIRKILLVEKWGKFHFHHGNVSENLILLMEISENCVATLSNNISGKVKLSCKRRLYSNGYRILFYFLFDCEVNFCCINNKNKNCSSKLLHLINLNLFIIIIIIICICIYFR